MAGMNPTTTFGETKIIRVTPGKLSRFVNEPPSSTLRSSAHTFSSHLQEIPARFKIYLHLLKLSKTCMSYIRQQLAGHVSITLKWNMFEFEDFITSPETLDQNKMKFDFTIKHNLEVNQEFVDKVRDNPLTFRLYAENGNDQVFLSESQFFINNIIEVVNVKQNQRVYFTSNIIDSSGAIIGYLDCWYKFTCKQKALRTLFPVNKLEMHKKRKATKVTDLLGSDFLRKSHPSNSVYVTNSEFDHFADSVLLVLNRNKVLKTTQSDIDTELQERVKWLRFEANWKQTLQENAILHGKNPEDVVWRQWREEDTANVRLRTYDDVTPKTYPPTLTITVVDLYFLEGCYILKNDEITQFYIEYSFLDYSGLEMETPFSLPKAEAEERIVFNFTKVFPIKEKVNSENCRLLADLIKNDGVLKFTVVSEPEENEDQPIQTCFEIGYAEMPFNDLIQLQDNSDTYEYEVIDVNNPILILGYMTITVEGILAMRKMALNLMAPKGYKLYM